MKSNIEAANMEPCCRLSKDCGTKTLVPNQVSADRCCGLTTPPHDDR